MAKATSATADSAAAEVVGLYGGTFDPVHLGHIHAACSVREALGLTEVRLVLAARPGHRGQPGSAVEHRWNMLQLACAEAEGLVADDSEVRRSGASYTVATVETLRQRHPAAAVCWILGQDAFATLPSWHRWEELLDFCNLIVIDRPGDQRDEPAEVRRLCDQHERASLDRFRIGQIVRLDLPMQEVSASEIRRRIAAGESVEHLLAAPIYTYITNHGLYIGTEDPV